MRIKNLFAFDFDDTLAITSSTIGIRRYKDEKFDESFRDWIHYHNLDISSVLKPGTKEEIVYFSSDQFAKYEKAMRSDLDFIESNNIKDEYDFSTTSSVDQKKTKKIDSVMQILSRVSQNSDSIAVIITARGGSTPVKSLAKNKDIMPTNREDIKNFLDGQGVNVKQEDITTAGDIGSGPEAKATALRNYIEKYKPKNIFFYDDNIGNVLAISDLCKEYFPEINITTYHIEDGKIKLNSTCSD